MAEDKRGISLAYVEITEQSRRNVQDCLDTGRLAQGKYVAQFEELIAEFAGTEYAVAVCNGTVADTIVLRAAREVHGWTSVTMPALTFAAQLSGTLDAGFTPYFVDVTPELQMGLGAIGARDGARSQYWFPASLMGVPTDSSGPYTIRDSCETFARGCGKGVLAATCSFYGSHVLPIGEGGAIVTDDEHMAKVCRSLRNHGQEQGNALSRFKHERHGYNGKISNLAAAVGCGQIGQIDDINARRLEVAGWYDERLGGNWASLMASPHGYPIEAKNKTQRNLLLLSLMEGPNIDARRVFSVLPFDEKAFRGLRCVCEHGTEPEGYEPFPVARRIADRWLYVPCHQGLSRNTVDYVCDTLESMLRRE